MRMLLLPRYLFAGGWMGRKVRNAKTICEDFREQDLNINILGASLCFDTGISCF